MLPFGLKMVQNAYAVESVEGACIDLHKKFGMGPFLMVRDFKLENHRYRGVKTEDVIVDAAVVQSGDLQIELMKVTSEGPNAISDMHDGKGVVMHHTAHICDEGQYENIRDGFVASGFPIASEFTVGGGHEVCFIDTRSAFNHMLELYSDGVFERAMYQIVRERAENWNKRDIFVDW
jgi:hypothetical protein